MRLWFARDIWRYRNVFWLIDWLILLFVCLFVLQLLLSQEKWSALTMHQHRHGRCSYAHIVITWWSGHELFWRFWWTWRSVGFAILFFVALFRTLHSRFATFSGKFGNMDKSGNSENRENWGERKKLFELFLSRKSCIFHFACNYESNVFAWFQFLLPVIDVPSSECHVMNFFEHTSVGVQRDVKYVTVLGSCWFAFYSGTKRAS